ncbi:MAG: hypothetical protein J7452_01120 [Thermoflexus sp.]|nr:hypothetical protein [Thermoflexus sp.]
MGFTVRDFNDLVRLLDRHPEWVEALRQRLLTRELLESPKTLRRLSLRIGRVEQAVEDLKATVQDLAQSVKALTESVTALTQGQQQRDEAFAAFRAEVDRRFAELAEAQRRTEESVAAHRAETDRRFAELAEAQRRHYEEFAAHRQEFLEYRTETDRRFAELAKAIRILSQRVDRLDQRVDNLDGQVRGWVHEDRYRTRPRRYYRLLLEPHILSTEERDELLGQAEADSRLTVEEAAELEDTDVLVRGHSRATGGEAFLVVEVSAKVNTDDVERAVKRAEILRKARPEAEVIRVAAGPRIHPLAAQAARDQGVWWLTDSRPYAPHDIPQES